LFQGKFTVLAGDDECDALDLLEELLSFCPMLRVRRASTMEQLQECTRDGRTHWHCWLLDIMWGSQCVMDLFRPRFTFPCVLLITGRATPEQVSQGMLRGAIYTFGKDPLKAELKSTEEVGALGAVLKGELTSADLVAATVRASVVRWLAPHKDGPLPPALRLIVADPGIVNLNTWAERCGLTSAGLESVCRRFCCTGPCEVHTLVHGLAHAAMQHVRLRCERLPREREAAGERAMAKVHARYCGPGGRMTAV
jgi:hypothetical protein